MIIKKLFQKLDKKLDDDIYQVSGWVRTVRSASSSLGFCLINDGSNNNGLQVVLVLDNLNKELIENFFKGVTTGSYISCSGLMIKSPAKGQQYEMQLRSYDILGTVEDSYPLAKSRMNLDTLRNYCHLRPRTSVFGSVFRIRSKLMKFLHDFYHENDFHHLDPNIITINECEGGAGVFQITENDISDLKLNGTYDWSRDHFCRKAYLTVSSQLQLEALACGLGNVYTFNKSFRSEHSSTSKHVSEFTHLEIEMVNNSFDQLMTIGEEMIKYCIDRLFGECIDDLQNLNRFISKGVIDRLTKLKEKTFKRMKYQEVVDDINSDLSKNKKLKLSPITYGDDLGSEHENYITKKYDNGIFVTHWPQEIKSFYMKQCDDGTCESFDLLIPYGIGELIGASQREEDYEKLVTVMDKKRISKEDLAFYLDLRKYGTCPHGGFGLGFDRLLMLMTGMQNIKDVIPFPVYYKSCKF